MAIGAGMNGAGPGHGSISIGAEISSGVEKSNAAAKADPGEMDFVGRLVLVAVAPRPRPLTAWGVRHLAVTKGSARQGPVVLTCGVLLRAVAELTSGPIMVPALEMQDAGPEISFHGRIWSAEDVIPRKAVHKSLRRTVVTGVGLWLVEVARALAVIRNRRPIP